MRGIQYFDFVEVFHCLTALESNMLVVMTVRTVLKVPFEKAAPPPCPSDVPAPLDKGNSGTSLGHLFITSSSFHFFNKLISSRSL